MGAIRNFGIIAHIDAGKTTLTEQILHKSGALRLCGAVDDGNTVSDYLLEERQRGISIVSAAVTCHWRGLQYNIVDTPGHIDFTAEVERSLRVMDSAIAVFCGLRGVQAQSEMVWRRAKRYGLPALAFVNKLDRDGASFAMVLEQLRELFAPAIPIVICEPLSASNDETRVSGVLNLLTDATDCTGCEQTAPLSADALDELLFFGRDLMVEQLAGIDDAILAQYLSEGKPCEEQLIAALRRCVLNGTAVPVFCGSANTGLGVKFLLDGIAELLPSPEERLASSAGRRCVNLPQTQLRKPNGEQYFSAAIAKVLRGQWPGDCVAIRIYSGRLQRGMRVTDARGNEFSVEQIWRMNAADFETLDEAIAGDIVGIAPAEGIALPPLITGDTLLEVGCPRFKLARMSFPEPVISTVLGTAVPEEHERLLSALRCMAEADPTLRIKRDRESGALRLWGLGELHLEIARELLKSQFGLEVRSSRPSVAFRSTVAKCAAANYEFVRNIAGLPPLQALIKMSFEPLPRGSGVEVCLPYKEHTELPIEVQDAVDTAIAEIVEAGSPSGFPLTDTRVTLLAGSTVMAEPSEPAFLTAVKQAADELFVQAGEIVLEPVTRLEVDTPQNLAGTVIADLNARCAKVLKVVSPIPGSARIVALVPLSELFSYATELRSLTCGKAEFTAEQNGYEVRHAPVQKTR